MRQLWLGILYATIWLGLVGCSLLQKKGVISSNGVSVAAVGDAGKPAVLDTSDKHEAVKIPAGSVVTITKHDAIPATEKSSFVPASQTTEIKFSAPTDWQKFDTTVSANTGTVDTSVAMKKVESAESRPLLYAAIASLLAAGFFLYRAYPTPAFACGGAAVVFFLAWKASGLPDWFWAVGACALAGAVALYLGHERGEKAKVVAALPVVPTPAPTIPVASPPATNTG